jgi:hypothetical protein
MTGKTGFSAKHLAAAAVVVVAGGAGAWYALSNRGPDVVPAEASLRRLTPEQYQHIIVDVFGPTIELGGRFEPDLRIDGLMAVGTSKVGMTAAGMEQYDAMARIVANQVVDEAHREQMIPCAPADVTAPDEACAKLFLGKVGKLLYRRPLSEAQLASHVGAAKVATETVGDFYKGLSLSLAAMLSSPQFLFRENVLEPDPDNEGGYRLDAYSKAQQLSFFLWNSGPDLLLLDAAEKGELNTERGLERQVDRMMASPRVEAGLRAFFIDAFEFDEMATLTKDATLFPKFSAQVAADAQEETLKTLVNVLITKRDDYRKVFTTKETFLTQELGAIYRVPVVNDGPNGSPDKWQPFTYAADDPRGGILTQISFNTLHSPPGRGSPTLRGMALREVILCQKVPAPPAAVDFKIVQDTQHPIYKTARKRLEVHATEPSCAGCHKIIDPIGLALENFDGAGEWRVTENGEAIDTSGELDGVTFNDAAGLAKAVAESPAAPACLVNRLSSYALGRNPTAGETEWVKYLEQDFASSGYRVPDLMREIAASDAFYRAAKPTPVAQQQAMIKETN